MLYFLKEKIFDKALRRQLIISAVMIFFCGGISFVSLMPEKDAPQGSKEKAVVLSVDNSRLQDLGLLKQGEQFLEIEIQSGRFKGEKFPAVNQVRAQLELDKIFQKGDIILAAVTDDAVPNETQLNAQDYYRINWSILLFALFALLLIIFAGITGFNALLSFVFSALFIWKIVVPLLLQGVNALAVCFSAAVLLSLVIITLVSGLTKKSAAALSGTLLGVLASCGTAYVFTDIFKINGAIMPYSQVLIYSGFANLSISDIYTGAIFLSSSGAVMDLAMDVASSSEELARKNPGMTVKELMFSGFRIGRSVVGTMTTTLLLAYSGGYITLMMAFAAQGIEPADFINNPHVASEVVKTLVGSFGLVLVAPFTAIAGAFLFGDKKNMKVEQ